MAYAAYCTCASRRLWQIRGTRLGFHLNVDRHFTSDAPYYISAISFKPRPHGLSIPTSSVLQGSAFSTSASRHARKRKGGPRPDRRIKMIRYHLWHPLTPRPLRLSRSRSLRHWTIHRAWQLFRAKQRRADELSLERQYNSMRSACEALRLIGEDGLAVPAGGIGGIGGSEKAVRPAGARDPLHVKTTVAKEGVPEAEREVVEIDIAAAATRQREVGKLYRIAMEKRGIFQGIPIEYARSQTDTPSRTGWDYEWQR